jgi:regulator of protease activity HflC (stomatin/prohibitin superfamily)
MADQTVTEQKPVATYSQVTQIRVPLDEAAYAFTVRDPSGRIPVVVVPSRPSRIRNEFVGLGALVLVVAIGEIVFFKTARLLPWAIPLSLLLLALGVYRSFMVRIPEGVDGLLTRGGRYVRTIGSGTQVVAPWFVVSHLVTRREIPFDVPVVEAPTKDLVRAGVDTLITFRITDAYKFVYSISADDFDEVLQAACQDGLRRLVRRISSIELIDLAQQNLDDMRDTLNAGIEPYGVTVSQITITYAQPPAAFMLSLEGRRLAAVQLEEQAERQALAQRRQADAETLLQQEVTARIERERAALKLREQQAEARKRVEELEAEANELRLARLEERLEKYPLAAQYEWESAQLEVARALASNSRAVLQVGDAGEIARVLVLSDLMRLAPEQGDGNSAGDAAVPSAAAPAEAEQSPEEPSTPARTSRTRKTTKS